MSLMFNNLGKIKSIDLSNFNTENVKNMSLMFGFTNLESLDLSKFKT